MNKQIYTFSFIALLVILALTFYVQVKTLRSGNKYQWYLLAIIIIVGLGSYYLSKHMKKENWFRKQQKRVRK